ncbi:protein of unknown function [Candidatus Methylomirabilis oxygeniifera]|uniref:Uncharacterized protein n=1 Tax=Methylomirabilis oxygeniifera TaxID=671143 RepID=D5MLT0_METO1|nr:protein of unknown function [Candidatus Methylomirabilis oxyfera]
MRNTGNNKAFRLKAEVYQSSRKARFESFKTFFSPSARLTGISDKVFLGRTTLQCPGVLRNLPCRA